MAVFSVSVPDPLLEQVDETIDARGYSGRSDLVRAALRHFLAHEREESPTDEPRSATLTLLYEEGSERKIGEIRHDYTGIIDAMMHAHAGGLCLEVFVLKAPAAKLREFQDRLRNLRETHLAQIVYTGSAAEGAGPGHHLHRGHAH